MGYVYVAEMVRDLMNEVLDYVGETEHSVWEETKGLTKKQLIIDFGLYLMNK